MLTRACKLPRYTCEYWEQYGTLGSCLTRIVHEEQDIMYIPRVVARDECNCNRYIRINDEATEMMIEMSKCNLVNVLYYYQQIGYPETAGWERDPVIAASRKRDFANNMFDLNSRIKKMCKKFPEYEPAFEEIMRLLGEIQYVEE